MPVHVVWFKRDLRTIDHAPLAEAARSGLPVLPLYVAEPSVMEHAPDFSPRHWDSIAACLHDLNQRLSALGQPLVFRRGVEILPVLEEILRSHGGIAAIHAHEETGNGITYARDRAVLQWARARGVEFIEHPSNGVVRRLRTRDGWARNWESRMAVPALDPPARLTPVAAPLRSDPLQLPATAEGGEAHAHRTLATFLASRGRRYHREMSSPVTAFESCSRLSAHLAYGAISTRMVVKAVRAKLNDPVDLDPEFRKALRAFDARLHWRCHFMQKLEDEPEIEFRNFVRSLDGLRDETLSSHDARTRFDAWCAGRTGYPMIDACMRCLQQTGWINFRMRAMLMSFAAYHLWLHWREPGLHLARLFTDYEPGIHWSQCQMQSGTTGMNTLRIYSPTKQAIDHDPDGVFIRRWIPELRDLPQPFLAEPWKCPATSKLGGYPGKPIVDHAVAVREAKANLAAFRRRTEVREEIREVTRKHGSRKSTGIRRRAAASLPLFD